LAAAVTAPQAALVLTTVPACQSNRDYRAAI
jgi:hypothetical protein